jgi:hypothetical protein
MNYAVEMGSGVKVYIPSFMNTGSGLRKLVEGGYTRRYRDTHKDIQTARLSHKPTFIIFFKTNRSRIK